MSTNRLIQHQETPSASLHLDVLVRRENNGLKELWVAQCLQYDIVTQAETLEGLRDRFSKVVTGTLILSLIHEDEPFAGLKPAPAEVWKQYEHAWGMEVSMPISVPRDRIPSTYGLNYSAG